VWLPCTKSIFNSVNDLNKKKTNGWISLKIYKYLLKSINIYRYI
jgi:hypothetical protein